LTTAVSIGVQVPSLIEDCVQREFKAIKWAKPTTSASTPLFDRLVELRKEIQKRREEIAEANSWCSLQDTLPRHQYERWRSIRAISQQHLEKASNEFWELNVADPDLRTSARLAEYLKYKEGEAKSKHQLRSSSTVAVLSNLSKADPGAKSHCPPSVSAVFGPEHVFAVGSVLFLIYYLPLVRPYRPQPCKGSRTSESRYRDSAPSP
jgi:hypothetical protein